MELSFFEMVKVCIYEKIRSSIWGMKVHDIYQISKWRFQVAIWIYESGVQGRKLGHRHTFPSRQHFLVFGAIIQDEITKGVSRDREEHEGLSLLGFTAQVHVLISPYSESYTRLFIERSWFGALCSMLCGPYWEHLQPTPLESSLNQEHLQRCGLICCLSFATSHILQTL